MQRLRFQRRQIDAGDVGLLAGFQRTDQMVETNRLRPTQGCRT